MATADTGRDNNLNLVRMLAATAVLISHAWPITRGPGTAEPLQLATGKTLGEIAVTVFFGLSGYLVTASWCRRPDPRRFAGRRLRRLVPGLWVSLALSALAMGPMVSALGPAAYLGDPQTWTFLWRNGLMLPVEPALPGVFEAAPYPAAAGSIWTLHYELLCYAAVLIAGLAGAFATPRRAAILLMACVAAWLLATHLAAIGKLHPRLENLRTLGLPFALGAAAWIWRDRVRPDGTLTVLLGAAAIAGVGTWAGELLLTLAVLAAAFWAGFVPGGALRRYNRLGDYSYGIYLYAFPVQGLVQHLGGPMTPGENIALALPPTLLLAVLSWHLVEKPWLESSPRPASHPRPA